MDCSETRFLLSQYLDDELGCTEKESVDAHIAECEDCAKALTALRSTTSLLADVSEIEPPAQLLEEILALTTKRPTLLGRVADVVGRLVQVPSPVRWAAVSAAVLLVAVSFFNNATMIKSTVKTPVAVEKPSQSKPQTTITAEPSQSPVVTASSTEPIRVETRKARSYRRNNSVAVKPKSSATIASTKPMTPINADDSEPLIDYPSPSESSTPSTVATNTSPVEKEEVKIAQASAEPKANVEANNDSMADLRAKLASKNRNRRVYVQSDPIHGQKVSIELASIKF